MQEAPTTVEPTDETFRLQDIIGPPTGPEVEYALPKRLVPPWAKSVICALWEPGIGEPSAWMLRVRFRDAGGSDVAILSGQFDAPEEYRTEVLRLGDLSRWPSLGAYWLATHLEAVVDASVPTLRTRDRGEARGYQLVTEDRQHTLGLLDVIASDEREVEVATIISALVGFFVKAIGDEGAAKVELERLARDLPPNDRFILRMQA